VNNVVSTTDIVNSKSMQVQILGKCPTVAVDKTDGCQIFLSRSSLETEILTAKSTELNVSLPGATDQDDYIEKPVPEQYKTIVVSGKLVTTPVEHSAG
jgi:adenylyl cyclase-associated protein